MMNSTITLTLAAIAGAVLGGIFFGGLWWTVQKGVSSRQPALLFLTSWFLRTIIVIAGLYLLTKGHLDRLPSSLIGFTLARFIVMRCTEKPPACHHFPVHGANHEAESR
jgi:F1F0 ATPase subunit 2